MKKRVLSFAMVMVLVCSIFSVFTVSASAASVYDCDKSRTITVQTKSGGLTKPSITFKCKADKEYGSKGKLIYGSTPHERAANSFRCIIRTFN